MGRSSKRETSHSHNKQKKIFKLQEQQREDPSGASLLPYCYFHTENRITKFCQCKECTLPLCHQCEPIHLEQHAKSYTRPEIDDYVNVRAKAISQLEHKITSLADVCPQLFKDSQRNSQVLLEERKRLNNLVNQFFRTLLDKVDSKAAVTEFEQRVEKIRRGSIKALIQYCSGEGVPTASLPTFQVRHNDAALLSWLRNTVTFLNNPQTKFQQEVRYQQKPQSQPYPQTQIMHRPLVQNVITMQPNIPQSNPVGYNEKRQVRFEPARPHPPANTAVGFPETQFDYPSVVKVQNSKQNRSFSPSPRMPSVQKFKSRNVLRNSCQLPSPIKQLNYPDVVLNQVYGGTQHQRMNQTYTPTTEDRTPFRQAVQQLPQTFSGSDGFAQLTPQTQQRVIPQHYQAIRPPSSHSMDQLKLTHHMHPRQVVQPVLIHGHQPSFANPSGVASAISIGQSVEGGPRKILTPEELQSMIVNKKGVIVNQHLGVYDIKQKPTAYIVTPQDGGNNVNGNITNRIESRDTSPAKDFWRAESYFEKNQTSGRQPKDQGRYQITVIEPPKYNTSNGFQSTTDSVDFKISTLPLRIQDLMSKNKF